MKNYLLAAIAVGEAYFVRFNGLAVVVCNATKDVALAYKPNAAFFEVFGEEGAADGDRLGD